MYFFPNHVHQGICPILCVVAWKSMKYCQKHWLRLLMNSGTWYKISTTLVTGFEQDSIFTLTNEMSRYHSPVQSPQHMTSITKKRLRCMNGGTNQWRYQCYTIPRYATFMFVKRRKYSCWHCAILWYPQCMLSKISALLLTALNPQIIAIITVTFIPAESHLASPASRRCPPPTCASATALVRCRFHTSLTAGMRYNRWYRIYVSSDSMATPMLRSMLSPFMGLQPEKNNPAANFKFPSDNRDICGCEVQSEASWHVLQIRRKVAAVPIFFMTVTSHCLPHNRHTASRVRRQLPNTRYMALSESGSSFTLKKDSKLLNTLRQKQNGHHFAKKISNAFSS